MRTFEAAWADALYGPTGFYRRNRPAAHFRTSVHASAVFAAAIGRLAASLGYSRVVDIGAGEGELGAALSGLEVVGVELDDVLPLELSGLVIANEWLDNIPCPVVELAADGTACYLLEDHSLGAPVSGPDLAWLSKWWPLATVGDRAEIGLPRDQAWADVVRRLNGGLAVAIDYGHVFGARPPYGTLTGFRQGRECDPVPDGSCDITAHVALDSLGGVLRLTQREALQALGVSSTRPSYDLARSEPLRYVAELSSAGEAAELLDPSGLGGFGWVVSGASAEVRRASRALSL